MGVAWAAREALQAAMREYAAEHPTEFEGDPTCSFREIKVVRTDAP
jgi:hypothetical protein